MFHPRRAAAAALGKQARRWARSLGKGGGTTLPGYLAERVDPSLVSSLTAAIPNGSIMLTGTNGKTTTTRMVADALGQSGLTVVTNPEGSNLLRGIATSLITHTDARGELKVPGSAIGVFEVDEGAFRPAVQAITPRVVLFTNLFRDQLDRYFEVDFVAELWRRSLRSLPGTTLVLNADDPQVAHLGEGLPNPVIYYGLEDVRRARADLEHASDSRRCPRCGGDLAYACSFYGHLGHYACMHCSWRRPDPQVRAVRVETQGLDGSRVDVATPEGELCLNVPLAGLYNVYNSLAATAMATALGIDGTAVRQAVAGATGAFGRLERLTIEGRSVCLLLVKNPSGFNESLRLVIDGDGPRSLLFGLNDNGPDGRDVSWIWDVDFELCKGRTRFVAVSGRRAWDLALRLKYGNVLTGVDGPESPPGFVEEDIVSAFWSALERTPPGETLYALLTYTSMWTLREDLVQKGHLQAFWKPAEVHA